MPKLIQLSLLNKPGGQERIQIIKSIAAEWEVVARSIGFDESAIKIISRDCGNVKEACNAMFMGWLKGEHTCDLKAKPVTWYSLIQCLEKTDKFEGLAYELKKVIMLQTGILITAACIILLNYVQSYTIYSEVR